MSKVLSIFGATGSQGRSVVNAVLGDAALSKEFRIRGITRDVSKPAAQELVAKGVEVVQADMLSKNSIMDALKGSHTVFLMTMPNLKMELETAQGKNVADVVAELGVKHLIFSSLLHMSEMTNGRLTNAATFETKADVERYIRSKGIPSTFLIAGYFMSNFNTLPFQNFRKAEDGTFFWPCPATIEAKMPLLDHDKDTGKFVAAIMKKFPGLLGKRIYAAVDYYTPARIISEFEEVIGKRVQFQPVDKATYMKYIPPPAGPLTYDIDRVFDDVGYFAGEDLMESLNILTEVGLQPRTWKEFLKESQAVFLEILD